MHHINTYEPGTLTPLYCLVLRVYITPSSLSGAVMCALCSGVYLYQVVAMYHSSVHRLHPGLAITHSGAK